MSEFSKAAKVGAMIVVLSAVLYLSYRFIAPGAGTEDGYRVWAILPDVTGVAPHSRVMVSGVQVGVVDEISLYEGEIPEDVQRQLDQMKIKPEGLARVDIQMKPEFNLYEDATVGKRAASFIGEYYIVLTPGTVGKTKLEDQDRVKNLISEASLQTLQDQASEILTDVKHVTGSLKASVGSDKGQQHIEEILKNLAEATEQLNAAIGENRRDVREALQNINTMSREAQPNLKEILENVKSVTRDVKEMTSKSDPHSQEGKPGEIRTTAERISRASESLESALKHTDNIVQRIDRGEGTVGRLTKDETLINEVEDVVEGVGDFVGGLGRLQTVVGLRTDYNFLANTIKSYVSIRLQPQEDKYYLLEFVNDPRGLTTFEQIDVDTTNPNDPPHYREIRTVTTNAFRFSFQFAKRMGPFTGRFGIRESTGGIGLDLHLLDDRFELQQDFFGFGEEITTRWRIALSYEFLRKLWLLGGVDNLLNDDRRDYFFGLQLRFNDADLKGILPFVPTSALSNQ